MTREARRDLVRRQLLATGAVSAADLRRLLQVSAMTVWRDLHALAAAGTARIVHGGAVSADPAALPEPRFAAKAAAAVVEKSALAAAAVTRFVRPGLTLALEGGSTVAALLPRLPPDARLTLLTNSLEVVRQAPPGASVLCSGGLFREVSGTFVGPHAGSFFDAHRADVAFISATGIDASGLLDPNPLEADVKRHLVRCARHVVLLLDHSKFSAHAACRVLPLDAIHDLLCTARPPRPLARALSRSGTRCSILRPRRQ